MSISTRCGMCEEIFGVEVLGVTVCCPVCLHQFIAKAADEPDESSAIAGTSARDDKPLLLTEADLDAEKVVASKNDAPSRRKKVGREEDRELDEDQPPKKKGSSAQIMLRAFVFLCALLGSGFSGVLGYVWQRNIAKLRENPQLFDLIEGFARIDPKIADQLETLRNEETASAYLIGACAAGFIGAILSLARRRYFAAVLLVGAAIGPAVLSTKSLFFTGALPVAGLFCLLIRSRSGTRIREEAGGELNTPIKVLKVIAFAIGLIILATYTVFMIMVSSAVFEKSREIKLPQFGNTEERTHPNPQALLANRKANEKAAKTAVAPTRITAPPPVPTVKRMSDAGFEAAIAKKADGTATLKLYDFDLCGAKLTIEAPINSKIRIRAGESAGISSAQNIGIQVTHGANHFYREALRHKSDSIIYQNANTAVVKTKTGYEFATVVDVGYQDFTITSKLPGDLDSAQSAMLIRSAKTLARKIPVSKDPKKALAQFTRKLADDTPGRVVLNEFATDSTLALLEASPDVRELNINGAITDSGLLHIYKLANLEILSIISINDRMIEGDNLKKIGSLSKLKLLKLSLDSISEVGFNAICNLKCLETLDTSFIDTIDLNGFKAISKLPKLKKFILPINIIFFNDKELAMLCSNPSLEELKVYLKAGTGLGELTKLPRLRILKISCDDLDNEGLKSLGRINSLTELKVNTGSGRFTPEGFASWASLRNLNALDFSHAKGITNPVIPYLGQIENLESLDLSGTSLTNAGVAGFLNLKKLKHLKVTNTAITEEGLKALDNHPTLEGVEYSSVSGTYYIPKGMR